MLIYMTSQIKLRIHDFVLSNGYLSIPQNTLRYMVFASLYNTCFLHILERLVHGYKCCTLSQKS
jgi:hypothetical protein